MLNYIIISGKIVEITLLFSWFTSAFGSYHDFLDRWVLLTRKLLHQGFQLAKLKSSLRKFYEYHHDLVARYGISLPKLTTEMFHLS